MIRSFDRGGKPFARRPLGNRSISPAGFGLPHPLNPAAAASLHRGKGVLMHRMADRATTSCQETIAGFGAMGETRRF